MWNDRMAATSASPNMGHAEEEITSGADFKVGVDNSPELLHEFNFSMRHNKRSASPIQKPQNGSFWHSIKLLPSQLRA